jgi:hypothetical protein
VVFVCIGIYYRIFLAFYLERCHVGILNIKKSHGLPEFASGPPLGGGLDANSGRPCTLIHNLPCKLFFGPLGLHPLV